MAVKMILSSDAHEFINEQEERVQDKIFLNIQYIEEGIISRDLFKKLIGTEIWELRTQYGGMAYRILAFWDKNKHSLVIATHGFIKKSAKTPAKEIARAEKIMNEYYNRQK